MAVSKRLRFEVMRRDGHRCRYCGRGADEAKLTIDHVTPEALGGTDAPDNLVAACSDCNNGKSATPADAAIVAGVSDDAVRWARARNLAAEDMLADLERRDGLREQFRTRWNAWGWPDGDAHRRIPMPADWQVSVDSILASGLPIEVLIECLNLAMQQSNRKRGPAHENVFRYMCGIAWNRVRELDEKAAALVVPQDEPTDPAWSALSKDTLAATASTAFRYINELFEAVPSWVRREAEMRLAASDLAPPEQARDLFVLAYLADVLRECRISEAVDA